MTPLDVECPMCSAAPHHECFTGPRSMTTREVPHMARRSAADASRVQREVSERGWVG